MQKDYTCSKKQETEREGEDGGWWRETDKWADRHTNRKKEIHTHKHTHTKMGRHTDRKDTHIHTHAYTHTNGKKRYTHNETEREGEKKGGRGKQQGFSYQLVLQLKLGLCERLFDFH